MNRSARGWLTLVVFIALLAGTLEGVAAATPQPPCANILANGSFETDAGWVRPQTAIQATYVTGPFLPDGDGPTDGQRALRLGTLIPAGVASYSSARQTLVIPADAGYVELSFAVWLYSQDTDGGDRQEALLLTETGNIRAPLWRLMPAQHSPRWQRVRRDLLPFRGERLVLYFNVYNDGDGKPSAMFVDDVQVLVCTGSPVTTTPEPTPLPTATSTPTRSEVATRPSPSPTPTPTFTPPAASPTVPPTPGTPPPTDAQGAKSWIRPLAMTGGMTLTLFAMVFLLAIAVGRIVVQRLAVRT